MRLIRICLVLLFFTGLVQAAEKSEAQKRADEFLKMYNSIYQRVYAVDAEANWKALTDVNDIHTGERIGADSVYAAFMGNAHVIGTIRELLKSKNELDPLTVREMEKILYNAAFSPGTIPAIVEERIAAEARQGAVQDGFQFCVEKSGDQCTKPVTPNQISDVLESSTDLNERKKYWNAAKEIGIPLRPGLIELQGLRNQVAKETGYDSYFALQVSDYGMTVPEMMALLDKIIADLTPLYQQLHTYTKHELAKRYNQPVPDLIPAHWLGNRWGQEWPGIVEGVNIDAGFKDKSPEWIVQQAERFYVSLGMPALPESFYKKSDLYELPADSKRKKNTHASAWNMDLDKDVRSLMSVKADFDWLQTTHHELGHIYYYMAYNKPDVPLSLREGANRAFHEAVGDLISIAAGQVPYLKQIGVLPQDAKIDQDKWLLNEALTQAVVFMPWSAGVMSHWEHDLYEQNLSPDEYNKKWWAYKAKYQGIAPPDPRDETYCDPATKTHINDDAAQYYDYALAFVIKYQLHDYIAKNILKQDPHNCNYYGNKEVGKWLWELLSLGATRDWREVIKEKTGEELSTRAMLDYYKPVMEYLQKANAGRKTSW